MFEYGEGVPWRVVITSEDGQVEAYDVPDVAALRRAWERVLADPRIRSWRYWRLPEGLPGECAAGHDYWPGQVSWSACRCGVLHVVADCRRGDGCVETVDPPYGPGCGPAPAPDFEAYLRRR